MDGSMQVVRRAIRSLVPGLKPGPRPPLARLEGITYTEDPVIERFVFICGLHRSGTTALERLLVSRYRLACLRANRPESEGQHLQSVYSPARAFGGPGRFAFSRAMVQELKGLCDHADCRDRILADWRRFVVGTVPVLLEKSPPNLTKIWWLRKVFPGSRFVVIVRDPRAVAAATQKWSGTSLAELMMHWNAAYSHALDDFRDEDSIYLRYEDLTAHPDDEIARLGAFLECEARPEPGPLEENYTRLRNSNPSYIAAHEGTRYGAGIWDRFGYEV